MILKIDGKKIKINNSVIEELISYKQDSSEKNEAGGVLIGSLIRDTSDVIIEEFTFPNSHDSASRTSFYRSEYHNNDIKDYWERSQHILLYLGEWHTHPENVPTPSSKDLRTWKKLLKKTKTDSNYLIFIIIGLTKIRFWIGNKEQGRIEIYEEAYKI